MKHNPTIVKVIPLPKLNIALPLYSGVSAGFPSPADDYLEEELDLNTYLIRHPEATFFVRVTGDSMVQAGIYEGDILIVDCALEAKVDDVVVAILEGEFTVKRFVQRQGQHYLWPENPRYAPIELREGVDFRVWGVVTHVIHKPYAL